MTGHVRRVGVGACRTESTRERSVGFCRGVAPAVALGAEPASETLMPVRRVETAIATDAGAEPDRV
jgi:hypothetical protein